MNKLQLAIIICGCTLLSGCSTTNYSYSDTIENSESTSEITSEIDLNISSIFTDDLDTDYYITSYCNIYDSNNTKIGTLSLGDKIQSYNNLNTNINEYTLVPIKYNDQIGYVNSEYLESTTNCYIDSSGTLIKSVTPDGTIYSDTDAVGNNLINYAYNYLYILPENLRQEFKDGGWKIELTDTNLSEEYNLDYSILAITLPEDKLIRIVATQSNIRNSLIHEFGHYIDYINNYISETNQWKEVKSSEIKYLDTTIEPDQMNNKEYFAESFRVYYSNDSVKSRTQMSSTMKLMKGIIEE